MLVSEDCTFYLTQRIASPDALLTPSSIAAAAMAPESRIEPAWKVSIVIRTRHRCLSSDEFRLPGRKEAACLGLLLLEDEHGGCLIDVTDVLLAVGTETDGWNIGEELPVVVGKLFLLKFKGPEDTVDVDDARYAA